MSKNLPWFRMYSDFMFDEKVEFLSFEDQRHYVFILCMKNMGLLDKEYQKDGMLDRVVAKRLGLYGEAFEAAKTRLLDSGLIDDRFQPVAWEKRQFRSDADSTAAERKRRQRERERTSTNGDTVKSRVTGTDVTRTDTDTDTDTDQKKPPNPPAGSKTEVADALFDQAMSEYPKRVGGDSRPDARKAWNARIKAGVKPEDIIDGVKRYAAHIRAKGKEHTEFVKRSCTFFGPGEHWKADYATPAGINGARDANGNAVPVTSQRRSFEGVDYGNGRVHADFQDIDEAVKL